MADNIIGIDIGGTNFRIGLVDESFQVTCPERKSSIDLLQGEPIKNLVAEIREYIKRNKVEGKIKAIGIGFPSILSRDKKIIYSTPNIKGLNNIEIAKPLSETLKIPVYTDRDVNFLLQYDIESLQLNTNSTILGFYVGTGLGNALYINGNFYSGKNGVAGELGHTPLYRVDNTCGCGKKGCAETLCSGLRLQYLHREYFSDVPLDKIFKEKADDPILIDFVKTLALPISSEITILDPDYVIIGGGVVFMEGFPQDLLITSIKNLLREPYPTQNIDIRFAKHTWQSGIIGSAIYVNNKINGV